VQNPAFYITVFSGRSDQPAREGPHADGSLELWRYTFPLSPRDAADVLAKLRIIPPLLQQARTNLVGNAKDLWTMGIRSMVDQTSALDNLARRVAGNAELVTAITNARTATDEFGKWLESVAASKTGPSGVGVENYNWYLQNVMLQSQTWQDQVTLMRRELARSRAALALEEQRNRALPPFRLVPTVPNGGADSTTPSRST
jgi:hypothetical protein